MASKNTERARDQTMAKGTQDHLSNVGPLTITGKQYDAPAIVQRLDARIAVLDGVTQARAALKAAIAAERADRPVFKQFYSDLRSIVLGMFSNDPETLADFGVTSRKAAPKPKTEAKLVAIEKLRATRKARNTMGKKQKKDVKGTVVPPTPAPTPSPAPAPAPSAASGTSAPVAGKPA